MTYSVEDVRAYWDSHLNLTQFLESENVAIGSDRFWDLLETSMRRYPYKDALFRRLFEGRAGRALLEIGCGLGIELGQLGKLGFDVTGVDLAPTAVGLCNHYLARRQIRGRACVQNAESLEFADASFDVVYSSGVLQHTPDIERAIGEIRRVLRKNGRILIILYHRHSWFYILHKLSGVNVEFEAQDAPIINAYTKKELRKLFSAFRQVDIECEYYYPKPTKRTGLPAALFNRVFVPGVSALPGALVKRFGWHLVLTAVK